MCFLILLHHPHIFTDLKYLDLIMFADKASIMESGFADIREYEEQFKEYCKYYTTGLVDVNSCYNGIILLRNAI